jgi:hypothetical protein
MSWQRLRLITVGVLIMLGKSGYTDLQVQALEVIKKKGDGQ